MKTFLCVGFLLSCLIGPAACHSGPPAGVEDTKASEAPAKAGAVLDIPAPEFSLEKVSGGELTSAELKGKVVIVDFWATWCTPCIKEIPDYNELVKAYAGKGVELVGVTVDSGTPDKVKEFAAKNDMRYTLVMGDDAVQAGFQLTPKYPTTYIIGKDWKIYKKYEGAPATKQAAMRSDIAALLAK